MSEAISDALPRWHVIEKPQEQAFEIILEDTIHKVKVVTKIPYKTLEVFHGDIQAFLKSDLWRDQLRIILEGFLRGLKYRR